MKFSDKCLIGKNKNVLCVGLLCLDIVTICDKYPTEDTDQRSICSYWQKGGNAANTSAVLGMLNQQVDFVGTVANNKNMAKNVVSNFVFKEMQSYNVDMTNVAIKYNHETPCSQVIINSKNGSRTILHCRRSLPELSAEDLIPLNFTKYAYIHFEGRSIDAISKAMMIIDNHNKSIHSKADRIFLSLEAEKPKRSNVISLMPLADLVVVSREFAESKHFLNAEKAVDGFKEFCKDGAFVVCTWGAAGAAYGIAGNIGDVVMVPAVTPTQVVDTLGAGDTFIGGLICGLIHGKTLGQSVKLGNQIASCKISECGYNHIKEKKFDHNM